MPYETATQEAQALLQAEEGKAAAGRTGVHPSAEGAFRTAGGVGAGDRGHGPAPGRLACVAHAPIREDSDTDRIEFLPDEKDSAEEHVSRKEMELLLHSKIADFRTLLNSRKALIFDQRLMCEEPVTLQNIGDRYGISRERIRQIEMRIIRVRDFLRREIPDFDSLVANDAPK